MLANRNCQSLWFWGAEWPSDSWHNGPRKREPYAGLKPLVPIDSGSIHRTGTAPREEWSVNLRRLPRMIPDHLGHRHIHLRHHRPRSANDAGNRFLDELLLDQRRDT